jgi:AbiV family abortive infection protein
MHELTKEQLLQGARAAFQNAKDLVEDARVLRRARRYARVYALSHMAEEELSKTALLLGVAWEVVDGREVQWPAFWRALRHHDAKLEAADGIHVSRRRSARDAVHFGFGWSTRWMLARLLGREPFDFSRRSERTRLRNWSLYAEWRRGTFQTPRAMISSALANVALRRSSRIMRQLDRAMRLPDSALLDPQVDSPEARRREFRKMTRQLRAAERRSRAG